MLQYLFPSENVDMVQLGRAYNALAAVTLLAGQPWIAVCLATLCIIWLQDTPLSVHTKTIDHYLILAVCSLAASVGSFFLLWSASIRTEAGSPALSTWMMGMLLQKGWALTVSYLVYEDMTKATSNKVPVTPTKRGLRLGAPTCDIHLRIKQGRDLVAKDINVMGQKTASDPYVIAYLGSTRIGKTGVQKKTLHPIWPEKSASFQISVLEKQLEKADQQRIVCHILDRDSFKKDDPMGTVYVPLPTLRNLKASNWYKVEKGEGSTYCRNPQGDLLVEVEVR